VRSEQEDSLSPGDWVTLKSTGECGVVVHVWTSDELGGSECYVAFFGSEFPPRDAVPQKPYLLRYAAVSLLRVDV
jgi:hypothetical protein